METLLEIQELDRERLTLNEQLRAYPSMWEGLKKRRDRCEADLKRSTDANKNFTTSRDRMEQEIRVGKDLLKRYDSQISLMRTQREVAALSTQIDQTKQRIAKFEEEIAELLLREQELKNAEATAQAALDAIQREVAEERDRIRSQIRSKKERLADIGATRKQLSVKVEKEMMFAYDRLLRRWPGTAIAPVRSGSCTGCHFAVLPQKLVEIHRALKLAFCDNCQRLLSEDEDYKSQEVESASA